MAKTATAGIARPGRSAGPSDFGPWFSANHGRIAAHVALHRMVFEMTDSVSNADGTYSFTNPHGAAVPDQETILKYFLAMDERTVLAMKNPA